VTAPKNKVLLLGLGNDVLSDDAVGLNVVAQLRAPFASDPLVEVLGTTEMGLALLDHMVGYREVLIVDSIQTGAAPPGTLHEVDPEGLKSLAGRTPHFLGVGETLALGRQLGLPMPDRVRIFAIEVQDPFTLATEMTPALQQALPQLLARVAQAVQDSVRRVSAGSPRSS
jgi:hydrogenase maturation protease